MTKTPSNPPPTNASTPSTPSVDWVEVGCIARSHGVRGEVRVKLHNAASEILFDIDEVLVRGGRDKSHERIMAVCNTRAAADGFLLLAFEGIETRNAADTLHGAALLVPRSSLPKEADDEFYIHDIIGARVELPDTTHLGSVTDFVTYPTADVLIVKGTTRYEIPMIDDFIQRVDTKNKLVVVNNVDDFKVD